MGVFGHILRQPKDTVEKATTLRSQRSLYTMA